MSRHSKPYAGAKIEAIKEEGAHAYATRLLIEYKARCQQMMAHLRAQNVVIEDMKREAAVAEARRAFGLAPEASSKA